MGYQTGNLKSELRYNFNTTNLGIPEEIAEQTRSREPRRPYQQIGSHILSSDTDLFFKTSSLSLTLGYIFNDRKEFEELPDPIIAGEGDQPSLHMQLATFNYNLLYHLPKSKKLETIVGIQGMHQTNDNSGEEVLIPDATTNDFGILATSHVHFAKSDIQFGLRYDHRGLSSKPDGVVGDPDFIAAIDKDFNSFNAAAGYRIDLGKFIIGRINLASGFRAPNLAELTSNGVHEGTNRYEIGNPDLGNEKNLQTDIALEYKNEHLELYVNGFYNSIKDYIYIEPNGDFIGTEAVFLYRQQDASLYGGEIGVHIHPHPLDWLHIESSLETVRGTPDSGGYLPLIPAGTLRNTLRLEFDSKDNKLQSSYAYLGLNTYFAQNNVSAFETPSPGYTLLNAGFGGKALVFGQNIEFRVSGNNLLDKAFISHLSRLKQDGIANIGRNISVAVKMPI
jgi:iron complex outermembrane receptor protein